MNNDQAIIYIGLGSNQNNPLSQLKKALKILQNTPKIELLTTANFYQTPAWGITDQPDFINSAAKLRSSLSPQQLLRQLKQIEYQQMGRQKNGRWQQRIIDLDILLYQNLTIDQPKLAIPHRSIAERWFVIIPLLELKPQLPQSLTTAINHFTKHNPKPKNIKKIAPAISTTELKQQ